MSKVVFTFGRINPPTRGHELLVSKVVETARSLRADHVVYLSQTCKAPTDPLDWSFKRRVCEAAFRGVNISGDATIRTPFQALEQLAEHYSHVTLVVGSDQVPEFSERMTPYATLMSLKFNVVSAGNRIDESNEVDGMSATKMRHHALNGDKDSFYAGLPTALSESVKRLVYNNVRKGLK